MTNLEGVARAIYAGMRASDLRSWEEADPLVSEICRVYAQAALDYLKQPTPASEPLLYGQGPELTIEQIKAMEKLP